MYALQTTVFPFQLIIVVLPYLFTDIIVMFIIVENGNKMQIGASL